MEWEPGKPKFIRADTRYLDIAVLYLEKLEKLDVDERNLFYRIMDSGTKPIVIELKED